MQHSFEIRKAKMEDVTGIAEVHIQSWRETYPGIMPEKKLVALNIDSSIRNWTNAFEQNQFMLVATVSGIVVGFAAGGKNRDQSDCETGLGNACECELAAIYILADYHKQGIGRALHNRFVQQMQAEGYQDMVIWVAEHNSATGFYTRMGGKLIDRKVLLVCEAEVPVVAYKFDITV